jgi:hypothetical protein
MSTTASQAFAEIRARLDAADSGISIPRFYQGDDPPILPDTPAPFVFFVFNNEGSGSGPVGYGGGRGRNLYRNRGSVEAYTFSPLGEGLQVVCDHAETVAARMRSYRSAGLSCFSADVIPIGPGSSISVPGLTSEVSNYQCAVAEIALQFDQIG